MINKSRNLFDKFSEDFASCEEVIKKHSKSFYSAFSQLPKDKARSVFAIYAFCRQADDAIDRFKDLTLLNDLQHGLQQLEAGTVLDAPIWRALSVVFATYDLPFQPFYDMLTGQRMDLDFQQPATEADLSHYSYYVAGSVGLMLLPILSSSAAEIQTPAKKLGEAMQRTNILRDIGEDLAMNRLYLPKETMERFAVTPQQLKQKKVTTSFIRLWEFEAEIAEKQYEEATLMMPQIDEDCQEALMAALLIYRELLTVIREKKYQVFLKKNVVSIQRKAYLLRSAKQQIKIYRSESYAR
jgi:4,4'-diapophytoene synthase